jgi:hypothetical protein
LKTTQKQEARWFSLMKAVLRTIRPEPTAMLFAGKDVSEKTIGVRKAGRAPSARCFAKRC